MSLESDNERDTSTYWSDDSDRMYIDMTTPPSSCPSSPPPSSSAVRIVTPIGTEQKIRNSELKLRASSRRTRPAKSKAKTKDSDDTNVKLVESGQRTSSSPKFDPGEVGKGQIQQRVTRGKHDAFQKRIAKVEGCVNSASKIATEPPGPSYGSISNSGKGTKRKQPPGDTKTEGRKLRNRRITCDTSISIPLRTKRRRTRSYRNSLVGIRSKTDDLTHRQRVEEQASEPVEQEIELDAEIDKVLEEKAIKNNLTATNVKSIIRQVITNNMVQKMMMSILRRERKMSLTTTTAGNANKEGHSSGAEDDDDILGFEPKLTRAKTKELFENRSAPSLWPITPMKLLKVQPPSEAQILMTSLDLPEESECEDEEYIPTEKDLLLHSDEESSRMTPSTSEHGSPYTPRPEITNSSIVSSLRNKKIHTEQGTIQKSMDKDMQIFKTPPPRPRTEKREENSGIGLRTRSRLPLNDTTLEYLEMQLIPPDITNDMYDFGTGESINEDYLMFLKDFSRSNMAEGNEDEEEADPEYNFMEDEEDDHDREEHRIDPAVKVTKKELNELVQGLLDDFEDYHFSGGEGYEDNSTLQQQQPVALATVGPADGATINAGSMALDNLIGEIPASFCTNTPVIIADNELPSSTPNQDASDIVSVAASCETTTNTSTNPTTVQRTQSPEVIQLFSRHSYELLRNQMTQHIQLLSQSYMFYVSRPESSCQKIASNAKKLIINLSDMSGIRGPMSVYSVPNLGPSVQLVTDYPKKSLPSPIKKKILEETYFNALCQHSSLDFPGWVIHAICGSNAFMHGSLLPSKFNPDDPNPQMTYFTRGEDALIAEGLSSLGENKMTVSEMATIISKVSVVIRTPIQVFRRIRNVKFHKKLGISSAMTTSPLAYYFKNKELVPAPHIPGPDNLLPLPPCEQPSKYLPKVWLDVVEVLNTNKRFLVKPSALFLSSKEVTAQKRTRKSKNVVPRKFRVSRKFENFESIEKTKGVLPISVVSPIVRTKSSPVRPVKVNLNSNSKIKKSIPTIQNQNITYPTHLAEFGVNTTAIPICNYNGVPEAYIIVPSISPPVEPQPTSIVGKENIKIPMPTTCLKSKDKQEITNKSGSNLKNTRTIQGNVCPFKKPQPPRAVDSVNKSVLLTKEIQVPPKPLSDSVSISTSEEEYVDTDDEEYNGFLESDYLPEGESVEESDSDGEGEKNLKNLQTETVDLCSSSEEEGEIKDSGDNKQAEENNSGKQQNSGNQNSSSGGADGGGGECCSGSGTAGSSGGGGGGGSDGDDDKDRKRKKQNSGNKSSGSQKKAEDTEDESEKKQKEVTSPARSSNVDSSASGRRHSSSMKKIKKSSTYAGKMIGKRTSKYNTESPQMLLEEQSEEGDASESQGVKDAFMDAFILKLQQRVEHEGRNPGLYNTIIQAICEFDSEAETPRELFLRMEDWLKDYPDLVKQLSGFISAEDAVEASRFIEHQQLQNEIRFMELLDKWTCLCPQLKSRIMQKYAAFRDDDNLGEVMEPFFANNPVMLDAFKTMFSSFYRPQSTSMDFEVLDLEMEEKEETSEDPSFEIVKLPEETSVPATHTCPCSCHSNTTSIPFCTRIKHCTKCCLKFQDGKVFVHNGRIMKPVNIEFTTPEVAHQIESGSTCISCLKPRMSSLPTTTCTATKSTLEEKELQINNSPPASSSSISSSTSSQPPEIKPWTREEDFLMLTVYQEEQNITSAIARLTQQDLFNRSAEQIRTRFMQLTEMLHKMTESESPNISEGEHS